MDAFSPPADDAVLQRAHLPMVHYARVTLYVVGAIYGALALLYPLMMGGMTLVDPNMPSEAVAPMIIGGVCVMVALLAFTTVPMFLVARGLSSGAKWAWIGTVVIGGIFAPSACFPFGVFLLYAMLNEEVRSAFLEQG